MPGIVDVPGVEVFGKGRGEFTLPCGHVDETGKVHKRVVLRETTGVEEDMMDDDEMASNERMTSILSDCCESIGTIKDKEKIRAIIGDDLRVGLPITSSDRIAMMIFLRQVSVGHIYHFERRCPRCGYMNKNKHMDLRKLEIKQVPEERVAKRRVEVMLERSGRKAVVRVLTASYETRLTELRPNQKDLRSAAILARLESLESLPDEEGKTVMVNLDNPHVGLTHVKALPQMDRNFLRKVYNKIEADVDTTIEILCASKICPADFRFPIDLGQAFFSNPVEEQVTDAVLNWL